MKRQEYVTSLAHASMGVTMYIIGHGNTGLIGTLRNLLASKKGVQKITEGPASELLKEAAKVVLSANFQNELSSQVATLHKEDYIMFGETYIDEALADISTLPADQLLHAKLWLYSIGEAVAKAVKDKGSKQKVSNQEADALRSLKSILTI